MDLWGSASCLRTAVPFVEADAAQARLTQRHERAIVDQAAEVWGLAVTHDLARVADRLEIARDDLVELLDRPRDAAAAPAERERRADDQRPPPAMAGRITIVSLSETPVSRPWSTRTSSSLR